MFVAPFLIGGSGGRYASLFFFAYSRLSLWKAHFKNIFSAVFFYAPLTSALAAAAALLFLLISVG